MAKVKLGHLNIKILQLRTATSSVYKQICQEMYTYIKNLSTLIGVKYRTVCARMPTCLAIDLASTLL